MNLGRWIIAAVCILLGYVALLILVRGWQLGLVDAAIGDLRAMTNAQLAYAKFNGGFNEGDLACLERLNTCIPSQRQHLAGKSMISTSPGGEPFSKRWTRPTRLCTLGPPADLNIVAEQGLSRSSVHGFRCVADASLGRAWLAKVSLLPEATLAFCADATGRVCQLSSLPPADGPMCPPDCMNLG